jgi:chromosome segregation ATPase
MHITTEKHRFETLEWEKKQLEEEAEAALVANENLILAYNQAQEDLLLALSRVDELEGALAASLASLEELEQKLAELKSAKKQDVAAIARLTTELEKKRAELSRALTENRRLQADLRVAHARLQTAKTTPKERSGLQNAAWEALVREVILEECLALKSNQQEASCQSKVTGILKQHKGQFFSCMEQGREIPSYYPGTSASTATIQVVPVGKGSVRFCNSTLKNKSK